MCRARNRSHAQRNHRRSRKDVAASLTSHKDHQPLIQAVVVVVRVKSKSLNE